MKPICVCINVLSVATVFFHLAASANPETLPAAMFVPTTEPASDDAATDLVVLFYKVLLQEEPPTIEQEKALFPASSAIRVNLIEAKGKRAADPIVLEYFREHKDWFLPIGMRSLNEISISALGHMVRSLESMKERPKPGRGFILAIFLHDRTAPPLQNRKRVIVFGLVDGKIDPSDIGLDGFEGRRSTLGECLKE